MTRPIPDAPPVTSTRNPARGFNICRTAMLVSIVFLVRLGRLTGSGSSSGPGRFPALQAFAQVRSSPADVLLNARTRAFTVALPEGIDNLPVRRHGQPHMRDVRRHEVQERTNTHPEILDRGKRQVARTMRVDCYVEFEIAAQVRGYVA